MIVYLIHAHKNLEQLNRLIALLCGNGSKIYVNVDRKSSLDVRKIDPRARLIRKRIDIIWGGWSQVEATLNSLEEIEEDGFPYSHVVFISGQDFPLVHNEAVKGVLKKNVDYISYGDISDAGWACQERFTRFHYHGPSLAVYLGIKILNRFCRMLRHERRLPDGMVPYGGSQWWNLTQSTVREILRYVKRDRSIRRFFRFTSFPDEFFFQSVVNHLKKGKGIVNENYRYIVFLPGHSNPEVLDMTHAERILSSTAIVCRKVEVPGSLPLMEHIMRERSIRVCETGCGSAV